MLANEIVKVGAEPTRTPGILAVLETIASNLQRRDLAQFGTIPLRGFHLDGRSNVLGPKTATTNDSSRYWKKRRVFDEFARDSVIAKEAPDAVDLSDAELARIVIAAERERLLAKPRA